MELIVLIIALFVSSAVYAAIPPLLDGIERKIKADIQSRVGPPTVLQTWYDILKLFSKEFVSQSKPGFFILSLSASLTLALLLSLVITYTIVSLPNQVPVNLDHRVQAFFLISLVLVLIISIHTIHTLIYTVSSNPFSIIGTFRALTIDLLNEIMFVTFLTIVFSINVARVFETFAFSPKITTPLFVVTFTPLLISVYISSRRLPYDLHEAEPELASGSIIELSGPVLGLYMYSHLVERYAVTSIPIAMLMLALMKNMNPLLCVLLLHLGTSLLYIFFGLISYTIGRSRVDLAFRTIALLYVLFIIISIGVYVFGYIYR